MEYLRGISLGQLIAKLTQGERVFAAAGRHDHGPGLPGDCNAAHELPARVVHRDVSPQQHPYHRDVKVIDFGIARINMPSEPARHRAQYHRRLSALYVAGAGGGASSR